jgi:hypothetical protein
MTLIAGAAAGCASPSPAGQGAPAIDIVPSGVEERDVVVQAVQQAAAIITGAEAEPSKDWVADCIGGEGSMFWYQVMVPDDGKADETLKQIAASWADLGIETDSVSEEVFKDVEVRDPGTGPMNNGSAAFMYATENADAFYMVSAESNCVPGDPEQYFHLTMQAGLTNPDQPQ